MRNRPLFVESLESRRLLAAALALQDRGVLSVTGTDEADVIEVSTVESDRGPVVKATVTDQAGQVLAEAEFDAGRVTSIKVDALAGDDEVHNNTDLPSEIAGGPGYNQLWGGSADDVLTGGEGWDDLYGGDGQDTLVGGGDWDILDGGAGNDALSGGDGPDDLYGGDGHDVLDGGAGYNLLFGGEGNDLLQGGPEWDDLYGEAGDDTLLGGDDWDILDGGEGDDLLNGQDGPDDTYGGAGADTFVWAIAVDEVLGTASLDFDPPLDYEPGDALALDLAGQLYTLTPAV